METMTRLPIEKRATFVGLAADVADGARELALEHGAQLRAEVRTEVARAASGMALLAAGGGLIGIGFVFVLIAGIELLQERYGLSATAAWGTVGLAVALIGSILAIIAHRQLHAVSLVPDRSLHSIRESLTWILQR